jgi:hypothetical protein
MPLTATSCHMLHLLRTDLLHTLCLLPLQQLVLISAGFDAADGDFLGCCRVSPHRHLLHALALLHTTRRSFMCCLCRLPAASAATAGANLLGF